MRLLIVILLFPLISESQDIDRICGWEAGDSLKTSGHENYLSSGSELVRDPVHSGVFSLKIPSYSVSARYGSLDADIINSPFSGDYYYVGFMWMIDNAPDTSLIIINAGLAAFELYHKGGVDSLYLLDANAVQYATFYNYGINDGNWHNIEIIWSQLDAGLFKLYIDDQPVYRQAGDFYNVSPSGYYIWRGEKTAASHNIYIDDIVCGSSFDTLDILGDITIYAYWSELNNATDNGNALDVGVWADCGLDYVALDSNGYENSGAVNGSTDCDNGTKQGLSGSTDYYYKKILASQLCILTTRSGGTATTFSAYYGNNVDGTGSATIISNSSPRNEFVMYNANIPEKSEYIRHGYGKSSGGRSIYCYGLRTMVAYETKKKVNVQ